MNKVEKGAIVVVAVAVISGIGGFVYSQFIGGIATAEPGECVEVTAGSKDFGASRSDCGAPKAVYKVVENHDTHRANRDQWCPSGDYLDISPVKNNYRLCLALDVRQGECLNEINPRLRKQQIAHVRVSCDSAKYKVTKIVQEKVSCGSGETPIEYAKPVSTICLGKP